MFTRHSLADAFRRMLDPAHGAAIDAHNAAEDAREALRHDPDFTWRHYLAAARAAGQDWQLTPLNTIRATDDLSAAGLTPARWDWPGYDDGDDVPF